jgi:hypothetical protein
LGIPLPYKKESRVVKRSIALFVVLLVVGCGSNTTPQTVPQAAYEGTATFVAALKGANTYASLPRCSSAVKPPCSNQAIVNAAAAAANKANIAVIAAQQIARDTTATGTDVQKAEASANDAVAALVKIVPPAQ